MRPVQKIKHSCINCGGDFFVYPSIQHVPKFCSYACRSIPTMVRFLRTGWTVKDNGCWEWNGSRTPKNYGYVSGPTKSFIASRLSWEHHKGPIPLGLYALHKCDNPPCVNPEHLFLGTKADNNKDMFAKGRNADFRGEKHPGVKLTELEVLEIRRDSRGYQTDEILARKYSVAKATISAVRRGIIWRHV